MYRCLHPVIAHVVRDRLTPTRRREVHRALAASLEAVIAAGRSPPAWPERSRVTRSRAATAGWPTARPCVASEGALQRFAFAEALSWLDLASLGGGGPRGERRGGSPDGGADGSRRME